MKKLLTLFKMLVVAIFIGGITLNAINHGNIISHIGPRNIETNIISNQEALEIIYSYLGISEDEVSGLDIQLMHEENLYDINFNVDDVTYNFKVHSTTGKILEVNN